MKKQSTQPIPNRSKFEFFEIDFKISRFSLNLSEFPEICKSSDGAFLVEFTPQSTVIVEAKATIHHELLSIERNFDLY